MKKYKYTHMYLGGGLPKTRKERDKLYKVLEATGIMGRLFSGSKVMLKENDNGRHTGTSHKH